MDVSPTSILQKTLGFRHRRACVASEISKLLVVFEATTPISTRESLGFGVTVFANVGLHSQAETDLVAFEERVAQWPEVRECHMLAGEMDFLLKIVAKDWDAYQKFLTNNLTPSPNVSVVKSALGIRTSKRAFGVPINADADVG